MIINTFIFYYSFIHKMFSHHMVSMSKYLAHQVAFCTISGTFNAPIASIGSKWLIKLGVWAVMGFFFTLEVF